jgi:hypothetical protein
MCPPNCEAQTLTGTGSISDSPPSSPSTASSSERERLSNLAPLNHVPPIAVTDLREVGLRLIGFGTEDFNSLVATSLPSSSVAAVMPLLPFSVFLRNEGAQTLIGYTVSWASTDAIGNVFTDYRTVFDSFTFNGLVQPTQAKLVTILVADPVSASFAQGDMADDIIKESSRLQTQASITIALEAVMYADGSVEGVDKSQSIEQMKARVRSEYDLYVRVGSLSQSNESILADLQLVSESVKPGDKLMFASHPYSQWYRFYAAKSASSLLKLAREKGVPAVVSYVRSTLATKKYPSL